MKKTFFLIISALMLFSCSTSKKGIHDKPVVIVSILPQKTFVQKIAGDDFQIQVLVPHGASPETYTLLPSQLKDISHADVWFKIGYIGFEMAWKDNVAELNKNMVVADLSEGLDLIRGENIDHGDHVHIGGVDPHTWLSPVLVKQMAENITKVLCTINPSKTGSYNANFQKFAEEIDRLDSDLKNLFENHRGKSFVTFHPSLSYFAREYGLNQYSLESDGKEPSPQHMAKVVEFAKKENIGVIYIQSEFDRSHARVFAGEIKGKTIEVHPLSTEWEKNLREMADLFIQNFK